MTSNEERIRAALPGYDVGDQIGKGGCGVVLSGFHRRLQRQVAIKQIPAQFADDAVVRRRFIDEAQLMASIDHPHVVPVYDYVEQDDLCLLVMEYLPGGSVSDRFSSTGFDAASAIAVALACAAGLEAAHRRGVLHRDVKPSNLMFARNGTVKLTDFGIARIVGGNDTLVTRAGEVIGTVSYMAPEQARGEQLSPATDVYALATMLYQLLSGVLPFQSGGDTMAMLFMHAFEQPTPLMAAAPSVPEPIADVVMRGLATDPTVRFGSAESFGVALAGPAADCWGANWLAPVGIPVIGADTIVAAATRTSRPSPMPGPATQAYRAQAAAATQRVRPAQPLPQPQVDLVDVDRGDVVPVQQVAKFRSPRVPLIVAGVLGLLAVALAVVGVGTPPRGGDIRPGTVTVAGVDPTTADVIELDLSKPIPVAATGVPADSAVLGVDVLGAPVGSAQAPLVPDQQALTGAVPPPVNHWVLAGRLTVQVSLRSGENTTATYRFGARSTQSAVSTAVAFGVVVLALFAVAYVESYIRTLRRGRNRFSGTFGLPLCTSALAVAVVGAVWVLLDREPTAATVVASTLLAAAAGVAATMGAIRVGQKYRYRRGRLAQELLLRVTDRAR